MLKKFGLIVLIILALLYIGGCVFLRFGQIRLIFFPDSLIRSTPQEYGLDYQDVWIDIEREKIHGWWIPFPDSSAPVLLYFHGNGSNNGDLTDIAAIFHQLGLSVLLIDYRGYGRSSQTFPSEQSVYQDAAAAWNYLTKDRQIKPEKIFVYGHSLGGAAVLMAKQYIPSIQAVATIGAPYDPEHVTHLLKEGIESQRVECFSV